MPTMPISSESTSRAPTEPSSSRLKRFCSEFKKFLIPEERISVKIIFDNVRNYIICGTLAVAGWPIKEDSNSFALLVFAGLLGLVNLAQTVLMMLRGATAFSSQFPTARPKSLRAIVYRITTVAGVALIVWFMHAFLDALTQLIQSMINKGSGSIG